MTNHKATAKSVRRDTKRRAENKSQLSQMKTFKKKCIQSIGSLETGKTSQTEADMSFRKMQQLVARAGRKNLIPQGRASRIISKLMKKKAQVEAKA